MALEIADSGNTPWTDVVRQAARSVNGDFLFVLPVPAKDGTVSDHAFVRLKENGSSRIVSVWPQNDFLAIRDEADIDAQVLGFARASVDVFERMRADERLAPRAS
jgi:hypothetical protein